jgi:hypothetical protein
VLGRCLSKGTLRTGTLRKGTLRKGTLSKETLRREPEARLLHRAAQPVDLRLDARQGHAAITAGVDVLVDALELLTVEFAIGV